MKEIVISLICIIIYQILSWTSFIIVDEEIYHEEIFITCWLAILICGIISYIKVKNKIIKNKKYNKKIFFISLAIFWLLTMCIYLIKDPHEIIEKFSFHTCSFLLCGLEYCIFWISQWIQLIVLIVYEIICKIISRKNKTKEQKIM